MKPGKLYLRIFLSFLIFLIITEIAILAVFMLGAGRNYQEHYNQYNDSKLGMAKELVEAAIAEHPGIVLTDNSELIELIPRLGKVFKSMVWLTDARDSILLKSFEGRIPRRYVEKYQERLANSKKKHYFGKYGKHWNIYLVDSIEVGDQKTLNLHILFKDRYPEHPGWSFAIGLIAIGLIIALMIIPVSRQITSPIKSLTDSAKRIEDGDLSHRVAIKRKDEIGELGQAFNAMANKVESMILSGKELTAQISHELRSPLARIQLAVELVKDQRQGLGKGRDIGSRETGSRDAGSKETGKPDTWAPGNGDDDSHLSDIQEDVEELDRLIGRILELSKLDIGESGSYAESIKPDEVLTGLIKRFKPVIENKSIQLHSTLNADAEIKGNREALSTALSNLVDNACKFTPIQGSIRLNTFIENQIVSVIIMNSCAPLTDEELGNIFNPFFRTDPMKKNGSGLGLAITKKIIEKHRGQIEAENTDSGLKLTVRIPV